ncbi:MAG TPA: hypothetical protein VD713_01535 [Sphingomonadales bacterium]|nr:hypothetical protein [Sphingomonadales bacterium]
MRPPRPNAGRIIIPAHASLAQPGRIPLFDWMRYQLANQPWWVLPSGFNPRNHATGFSLENPDKSAYITGDAPVEVFARSGYHTAIYLADFAHWKEDYEAYNNSRIATKCLIVSGEPDHYGSILYDRLEHMNYIDPENRKPAGFTENIAQLHTKPSEPPVSIAEFLKSRTNPAAEKLFLAIACAK